MSAPAVSSVDPSVITRRLLDAISSTNLHRIEQLLDPDVWFRMLLPRQVLDLRTAAAVVDAYHEWFVTPHEARLVDASSHRVEGREHLRYRFVLRPQWAADTWHLIEQAGYARVADGRVRRLDLVCTGFHPTSVQSRDRERHLAAHATTSPGDAS